MPMLLEGHDMSWFDFSDPLAVVHVYQTYTPFEEFYFPCTADCDGDGAVNILDFVCFQNEWVNQSPIGDCDGDGVYNILDFVCYQNEFVNGCD